MLLTQLPVSETLKYDEVVKTATEKWITSKMARDSFIAGVAAVRRSLEGEKKKHQARLDGKRNKNCIYQKSFSCVSS